MAKRRKKRPKIRKENRCNYHLCRKKTKLYKCRYCGNYFCKEHRKAKPAGMPRFIGTDAESELFMQEFHKEGGHPCIPYIDVLKRKIEKQKDEWGKTLDVLTGRGHKKEDLKSLPLSPIKIDSEEWKSDIEEGEVWKPPKKTKVKKTWRRHKKKIIFFGIIILLIVCWYFGILDNFLSGNPYIGGIFPLKSEHKDLSSYSFDKINSFRIANSISKLDFDKNNYNLAVDISKNIYKSEGYSITETEFNSLAKSHNLEEVKYISRSLEKIDEINVDLMISRWKTLSASSEIILNESFNEGAIGCYKKVCTLVVDIGEIKEEDYVEKTEGSKGKIRNYDYSEDASASSSGSEIDIYSLEKEIHNLVNQERRNTGLGTLAFDEKLAEIARSHSLNMAKNSFFSHYDQNGRDPTDRASSVGYSCYKDYGAYYTEGIAENIFQNNLYDSVTYIYGIPSYDWNSQSEIAQSTVEGWMNSPGHRENILTAAYDKEGIGVAISSDDRVYITEDFC